MTLLRESESVPFRSVDDVDLEGQGKKVVDARLRLEERRGPTPARRVVAIETRDGAVYRFQRYARDEYLAFYNRENPDGSEFQRNASLPAHVQAVREAIMADDVLPDFEALMEAERQVGERDYDSSGEATDAEVRRAIERAERGTYSREQRRADGGKSWVAQERKRADEARLRSGYATDGGEAE